MEVSVEVPRTGRSLIARAATLQSADKAVQLCYDQVVKFCRAGDLERIRDQEMMPCARCADLCPSTVNPRCTNCWEVEGRIEHYLETLAGRLWIRSKLEEAEQKISL